MVESSEEVATSVNIQILDKPAILRNGDRLKQPEFHRRYLAYPGDEKFELIGGIVYMASPVSRLHSLYHQNLSTVLGVYTTSTFGVEAGLDATNILGEESEPQPDLMMRILTECGGRSSVTEDGYYEGASELLAEVAYSSVAIDLHDKHEDYRAAGIQEYLVVCVEERELHWFDFANDNVITANRQGVYRSRVFPGLWLHGNAFLELDSKQVTRVLQQGIASREHAAFVRRLERARREHG